jgi:hypothetical protein
MQFICDAYNGKTWFRLETEAEASAESALMSHAVEKYFRRAHEAAAGSYNPVGLSFIERDIGLKSHIARTMPLFATLRDEEGKGLATAMLPPQGKPDPLFRVIIVGPDNADPYLEHAAAIEALGRHFGLKLPRERCFPY